MAINDTNRIISTGVTKLEKKNYATLIDATEIKSLSELANNSGLLGKLSDLSSFDPNSLIDLPSLKDHDIELEALGQFGNPFCCKYPPLNLRLPNYKIDLSRNLDFTFTVEVCGESKTIDPIDYLMKATSFVNQNPGIFSSDASTRLRALLSSDLVQKMNIAGLGSVIPDCILDKVGGYLSNVGSPYGNAGTLSTRKRIDNALSKDKCARLVASQVGLYDFLSAANNSHFINMVLDGDPTRAETYFSAVLGVELQRISFMTGYSQSFREEYAVNQTYAKLEVFNTLVTSGKITQADRAYCIVNSEDVLTSIAQDETENKDIDNVITALDFMSPDWNRDEEGNTNLYKTKGNEVMAELAINKLLSSSGSKSSTTDPDNPDVDDTIDLDGVYETILSNEHHIAIINAFE